MEAATEVLSMSQAETLLLTLAPAEVAVAALLRLVAQAAQASALSSIGAHYNGTLCKD
jgi:hypothetical protein